MQHLTYNIHLHKEPEGGYTVIIPALPGCITWGEDIEQATLMAREAIEGYIATLKDIGEPIPDDSDTLEMSIVLAA
jgi:antitoxin HicB